MKKLFLVSAIVAAAYLILPGDAFGEPDVPRPLLAKKEVSPEFPHAESVRKPVVVGLFESREPPTRELLEMIPPESGLGSRKERPTRYKTNRRGFLRTLFH